MTGIDLASLQRYEKNLGNPTPKMVARIVQFLGYNPLAPATTLGERLRRVRVSAGLSIRQLSNYLGVDSGSLSRWETESKVPFKHHLQLLEAFLQRFENAEGVALLEDISALREEKPRSFDHPLNADRSLTLGSLLYKRRMELGLSQTQAGKKLKVGRGAMWNWESDGALPNHVYMSSVVQFLGCVPWPKEPGRRIQVCRLALGHDCIAFERKFKIWRRILSPLEAGKADPPDGLAERMAALVEKRFPASKFPRVEIADLALRARKGSLRRKWITG